MANTHDDELAPIDYLAVEFPDGVVSGSGFERLVDMVDQGIVRLLDLEFIEKGTDGTPRPLAVEDVATGEGVDLAVLVGASSGLLDPDDIVELTSDIAPGRSGGRRRVREPLGLHADRRVAIGRRSPDGRRRTFRW